MSSTRGAQGRRGLGRHPDLVAANWSEQAGAKAFINKPFDRDEILGALDTVLAEHD